MEGVGRELDEQKQEVGCVPRSSQRGGWRGGKGQTQQGFEYQAEGHRLCPEDKVGRVIEGF